MRSLVLKQVQHETRPLSGIHRFAHFTQPRAASVGDLIRRCIEHRLYQRGTDHHGVSERADAFGGGTITNAETNTDWHRYGRLDRRYLAGHLVNVEAADAFNALLREFIHEVERA